MNPREAFRRQASARRDRVTHRAEASARMQEILWSWLLSQWNPDPTAPVTLCCYVAKPPEAETRLVLQSACDHPGVELAVPFCDGPDLKLFRLDDLEQLGPSQFGLSEPRAEARTMERQIAPGDCSLFVVPGLAFDRHGNRLGYGKGFYDRLLGQVADTVPRIGYAFADQIYAKLPPTEPWDIPMNRLLTENGWIEMEQ